MLAVWLKWSMVWWQAERIRDDVLGGMMGVIEKDEGIGSALDYSYIVGWCLSSESFK